MGGAQSTSTISEIMSSYNANLTSLMNSVASNSSASCTSNNSVKIKAGNIVGPCTFNVAQNGTVVCNLTSTFNSKNSSNLNTLMSTAAQQTASAAATSLQGALGIGVSNSSTNVSVQTALQNVIKTDVANNIVNSCIAQGEVNNNYEMDVGTIDCTSDSNALLNLVQGGQLSVVASCITDALTDSLESTATYTTASQAATATSSATTQSLFAGLFGTPMLIAFVVVMVCCLGGLAMWYVIKHRGTSGSPMARQAGGGGPSISSPQPLPVQAINLPQPLSAQAINLPQLIGGLKAAGGADLLANVGKLGADLKAGGAASLLANVGKLATVVA